eukprot:GILJ01025566.1.p1 GENE.GILJ01025566.1~~GILJ01025566.1.p1  ORF type:complete len:478 (+),score=54.20 GILJ01025566.1:542-1975(+)
MADELRLLRGYIPEHIRKQLLEARRPPAKYSTDTPPAAFERNLYPLGVMPSDTISMDVISAPTRSGSRSHSHSSDSGKIKGTADASTLPTATQPAFDAEAIKRWDTNNVAEKVEVSPSESDSSPSNNEDMHPPPMTTAGETTAVPPPISYTENGLVQRNLSVVVINILGLHQYVQATPLEQVVKEHEAFVSYLHEAAKRFGGALDNFNGDKFWVSFNATVPCEDICVAATLFALEIATTVKKEMLSHQRSREASVGKPPLYMKQPLTQVAWRGVSMGVAAGKGFVGTLGTNKIRRHTITSGAVAEAAALERMAARYPDCSVLVSESLLPMIEGYFQYIVLDATALPGSGGKRRRIISIRAPMLSSSKRLSPALTRFAHKIRSPLPVRTPYRAINECFSAFLEGRPQIEITNRLSEISNHMELSRQANPTFPKLPDGRMILSQSECANISMIIHYIYSLSGGAGASYCGPLGNLFEKV